MISINDPVLDTYLFISIFCLAAIFTIRRKKIKELFPTELTQELKGLAILFVVFSHIGYFLISDHRFLFPLSILAGVGVNLFLFLSGYGLSASALNADYSIWQFYQRRLKKIYIPLWLTVVAFLSLDHFVLQTGYGWAYAVRSLAGFFPSADLYGDLNSPLWYITLISFYFLLFPLVFYKKHPWISAAIVYIVTYVIVRLDPVWLKDVMRLYEVHLLAFPLGMAIGGVFYRKEIIIQSISRTRNFFSGRYWMRKNDRSTAADKDRTCRTKPIFRYLKPIAYYSFLIILAAIIAYTAINSNVGGEPLSEELTSLVTMSAIILIFSAKKFEIGLLHIFGLYSYEIYLLHWPILSRYDIFYGHFPAWLATIFYLALFLALGRGLKKIARISAGLYSRAGLWKRRASEKD